MRASARGGGEPSVWAREHSDLGEHEINNTRIKSTFSPRKWRRAGVARRRIGSAVFSCISFSISVDSVFFFPKFAVTKK